MTRDEVKTILATMAAVYSVNLMPQVTELTVNVWFQLMQDIEYKQASTAVALWLATQKYPPTVADIREKCISAYKLFEIPLTPEEAWGNLIKAVRKYGHTMESDAANTLDQRIWKIVERFGWDYWCQMPMDKESTYFAQFRSAYENEDKRVAQVAQIPASIRNALQGIGSGRTAPMLESGVVEDG